VSIYALYTDGDAAQRAVNALRTAGVDDSNIEVMSAEPMEHFEFGQLNRATLIWYIASLGGLFGLAFGAWLTRMTELAWPLPTGNMPIVAWWPNMIVIFELTMLGGILATVGTLIVSGGLLRRRSAFYDPEVGEGKILVGVENPSGDVAAIERALGSGATAVKRS
jgi:molybdopterin-containing oxidoreductase family membrane subunit